MIGLGLKKKLLFSHNGPKKTGQVGRYIFFSIFLWSKMCVLCMFYFDWESGGRKKL